MQPVFSVAIIHPNVPDDGRWIDDFVDPAAPYRFRKVGPRQADISWHTRGATTTRGEMRRHFAQAYAALRDRPDVVVANFPPLIFAACVLKTVMRSRTRVVGWSFNFGGASKSRKALVFGPAFRRARILVTHSRGEIGVYAAAFRLPPDSMRFVPFQQGKITVEPAPEAFDVVAMGSAGRDYAALIEAVAGTDLRVLLIAKRDAVGTASLPANVQHRDSLTMAQCHALAAGAPIAAVPVAERDNAAGQVTVLAAMALARGIVATRCTGTEDYLTDGQDALLVPPGDPEALRAALLRLHGDQTLCATLGAQAHRRWQAEFSDEKAGRNLRAVLDDVMGLISADEPVLDRPGI